MATTEDESIDISDAAVVRTQLTGGIKMNISFTRKSSLSKVPSASENAEPSISTSPPVSRNYGFRQTPDRQQREAAARLGYATTVPKFISTPRASKPKPQAVSTPGPLTYQVELDMQSSGLPKLRFKRTDSFNTVEGPGDGLGKAGSPSVRFPKTPRVDSPLAHCTKHRGDPGCRSPSLCTPGKGSIQTRICQSYTPTHTPGGTPSPPSAAEVFAWTPSPQSRADGLNSWPRKKRVGVGVSAKEQGVGGPQQQQPLLREELEDPELEGVFRLQEVEECRDAPGALVMSKPRKRRGEPSPAKELVEDMDMDMDWTEALVTQFDAKEARMSDDMGWLMGKESLSAGKSIICSW